MAKDKTKTGVWITTEHLGGPAYVVAVMSGLVKVKYRGRYYFFKESEVEKIE